MPRLVINGVDYTKYATGLEKFDIDIVENSTKTISRSISSNIKLTDKGYDLIKDTFFSSCSGFLIELDASLTIDICGGTTFYGKITVEGIELDYTNKTATIVLKGKTDEATALSKLGQYYIWENGFIESAKLPIVHYTKQTSNSSSLYMLRILIGSIVFPLALLSKAIAGFIVGLCNAIDFINIFKNMKCPKFNEVDVIDNLLEAYDNAFTGNGRWAAGILVREAINYQCKNAGINFSSSILNNPSSSYYNLTLWSLTGGKFGDHKNKTKERVTEIALANAPLMTTTEFLDSIKDMFACDYKIVNGTLYFEPIDFFKKFRNIEIKLDQCANEIYKYDVFETFAYLEAYYKSDQYDLEGSKVFQKYYQTKIEFNDPPREAQKGKKSILVSYSPTRFMFDIESGTRNGFFDFDLNLDFFKSGEGLFKDPLGLEPGVTQGVVRKQDMVITADLMNEYKLLILEDGFDYNDAKVVRNKIENLPVNPFVSFYEYNTPLHFTDKGLSPFLSKFNPRISEKSIILERISLKCNCDLIDDIIQNPYALYVTTSFGKGYPEGYKVIVDYEKNETKIEIDKIYIDCNN